jgi:hypothetical protein
MVPLRSFAGRMNLPDQAPPSGHPDREWRYLRKELAARTIEPTRSVSFVIYVFLGPFLFGALGVWVEIFKLTLPGSAHDYGNLITAVCTYFPALGCSTALQLVLASSNRTDKVFISFALLLFVLFLVIALVLQGISVAHPKTVLQISAVCSASAIWLCWITNAKDPTYLAPPPDAATGGGLDRALPGNLAGFKT